MALEFSQAVRRIPVYPAAEGYGDSDSLARLASNESAEPPLPEVVRAATRALGSLNRYPDPTNAELRRALSDRYDVPASRIAIGNGSCDVLLAAGEALLEPGAEVVYAWPSFSVYPQLSAATGARAITVQLDTEQRLDLDAMAREVTVACRLVIVCNPNNPTSTAVSTERVAAFLERIPPHVCVIVDEAYCEFRTDEDPDSSLDLLARHPNLALLRTFSKVYGLCGLRVGFALCGSEELPRALDQVRQPFFCNAVAQAAATEALKHQDAVADRVVRTVAARIEMDERLRALGLAPADSQANFCWFDLGEGRDEDEVVRGLGERGVLVRAGSSLGRPGALRVTYGLPEENRRLVDALGELL
ncbi:MAG: histidinol-phosphate transaminase [Actinobacteria bacterium]|nr:MAG: histidinol-phosphate transaminase [Actinomycetota bacterium]